MSLNFSRNDIKDAIKYNAKSAYVLPSYVTNPFPKLREPMDSEVFAWAIHDIQFYNLGFRDIHVDGKLGHQTYTALLSMCRPVKRHYITNKSERIALPFRSEYKLICYDEPGGKDLHFVGNFSKRKEPITAMVLHWGGLNVEHCYNVFASDQRQVSSHFLIGKTSMDQVVIYQTLDLAHAAWHGGHVNQWTIGIDICQTPNGQWLKHYQVEKRDLYTVEKINNPTNRGPRKILSLDPVLAKGAKQFIKDLHEALKLEMKFPESHDCYTEEQLREFSVFGHHHSNLRKYDIACWWDAVIEGDKALV